MKHGPVLTKWAGVFLLAFVAVAGMTRAQTGLTLRGDSVSGLPGTAITVTFRVEGFWEITQGMGTIQWDSHVMDYVSAGDFGIGAIDEGTFTRIPEGMLTFDWTSGAALGNTLPDGSVLFSLTFNVRGDAGDATTVAFTDGWTALHFESEENINLPFSSVAGHVAVVPEPAVTSALLAAVTIGLAAGRLRRTRRPKRGRAPRAGG